jgi:hypothetical protein
MKSVSHKYDSGYLCELFNLRLSTIRLCLNITFKLKPSLGIEHNE